jgi:hypothetical protein
MPTVRPGHGHKGASNGHIAGQVVRSSEHSAADNRQSHHDDFARDDLKGAYAGNQNESKFQTEEHATKLKARKTKNSATKTPKM